MIAMTYVLWLMFYFIASIATILSKSSMRLLLSYIWLITRIYIVIMWKLLIFY